MPVCVSLYISVCVCPCLLACQHPLYNSLNLIKIASTKHYRLTQVIGKSVLHFSLRPLQLPIQPEMLHLEVDPWSRSRVADTGQLVIPALPVVLMLDRSGRWASLNPELGLPLLGNQMTVIDERHLKGT